jgi:hypothetical protein
VGSNRWPDRVPRLHHHIVLCHLKMFVTKACLNAATSLSQNGDSYSTNVFFWMIEIQDSFFFLPLRPLKTVIQMELTLMLTASYDISNNSTVSYCVMVANPVYCTQNKLFFFRQIWWFSLLRKILRFGWQALLLC